MESWEPTARIREVLRQHRAATFDMLLQGTHLPGVDVAHLLERMEAEDLVTSHGQAGHPYWTLKR